jgi:hypothetical protein
MTVSGLLSIYISPQIHSHLGKTDKKGNQRFPFDDDNGGLRFANEIFKAILHSTESSNSRSFPPSLRPVIPILLLDTSRPTVCWWPEQ